MRRAVLGFLALAGCMEVQGPAVQGPGDPPKIGSAVADLGGTVRAWDLYDYSVGAYDASVQVYDYNGQARFSLTGDGVGQPNSKAGQLRITAEMARQTQTGALAKPVVEVIAGEDFDGARLTSVGSRAEVVLDSLTPMGPQSEYGHVTGHFSATLCEATGQPARVDRTACQQITGTFSSDLQIGGP